MTYKTHLVGGACAWFLTKECIMNTTTLPITENMAYVGSIALLAGTLIGSLIVDIDHRQSFVSRRISLASKIVSIFFTHRNIIHTPIVNTVIVLTLLGLSKFFLEGSVQFVVNYLIVGLAIGIFSHLLLDTFNPKGIMWLYPISKKRFKVMKIGTRSYFEKIFLLIMVAITIFFKNPKTIQGLQEIARLNWLSNI